MDVPVEVFEGDTLCFKSFAEPGYFATALSGMQYTETPSPSIYWKSPGDSAAWYYPRYGDLFVAPSGQFTLYIHVKDNYCQYGSTSSAYMIIDGMPR
jgi:hypothetical protein